MGVSIIIAMIPDYWGALNWLWPVAIILLVALIVVVWTYITSSGNAGLKTFLSILKLSAICLLAICLLEPMNRFTRPEPGANLMLVMADDSQSLQIKDRGNPETRESIVKSALRSENPWMEKLENDFDVRRYQFDRRLRSVSTFNDYVADQRGSDIVGNLELAASRFVGRPAAGILLFTDGNVSDLAATEVRLAKLDWENCPPIYPVVVGTERPAKDLGIVRLSSTQSNFESAPVTVTAELVAHGYQGETVCVQLIDEDNSELELQKIESVEDGRSFAVRFKVKPDRRGVNVYRVRTFLESEEKVAVDEDKSKEATIVNNERTMVVNRGRGPFRVLYVSGRPNWELKFLRRAMADDPEIDLVALVRIAKREAKFTFRGNQGQQSNPLYKGFGEQDEDTAEKHDEPVFLRLGVSESNRDELLGGFPKDTETLFQYDAIVLDDVESKFFNEDQKSILQKFVSIRGGGLLMLGGQESFAAGEYDRTPIGEMIPVYLDDLPELPEKEYQLNLTREGWLQPWVRVESTEEKERLRLRSMPKFQTLNLAKSIKPGATVLATVKSESGKEFPALVVQAYGKGRSAALLVGDWWRWHLKSPAENDDMMKAWRQTLRWLVADVPRRLEAKVDRATEVSQMVELNVDIRDENFKPFDNATVQLEVATPDGKTIQLTGRADDDLSGRYATSFASGIPGAYRATVTAQSEDGQEIEGRETGWVSDPDSEEFQSLIPNRRFLESLAERSGGAMIELDDLDQFADTKLKKDVLITETKTLPWWHRWTVFTIALTLLVLEWGIRRVKGMP